jgi:hypothetical protein
MKKEKNLTAPDDMENTPETMEDDQTSYYSDYYEPEATIDKKRIPLLRIGVSGLYTFTTMKKWQIPHQPIKLNKQTPLSSIPLPTMPVPNNIPIDSRPLPIPVIPIKHYYEELRLDVDGMYPQMQASGSIRSLFFNTRWIAELRKTGSNTYEGKIWYTYGLSILKYHYVKIKTIYSFPFGPKQAIVIFSGAGVPDRSIIFGFKSKYFHDVEFEFDYEEGITPITSIGTYDHPNHPPTLPDETISIDKVFRRTGFNVSHTSGAGQIPSALKGANGKWSDNEMHDAMQTYWSKFADKPQWSMWTLFAQQHDTGRSLGGVMFDDIGPNHRQGTSLFYDSFISDLPAGDPDAAAFVARMKFWTAVHEMGHTFNLAHSWQKELGNRWIPGVHNENNARSFMNYPYNVPGSTTAFFSDFEYRFSDQELLFLRHAPYEFVEMGNADWFENHAFEWAKETENAHLQLVLRVNKPDFNFEFMEPVCVELKITNTSPYPKVVDSKMLADMHNLTLVVQRKGASARQYRPFAQKCYENTPMVLQPGVSMYESIFISAGVGEWLIDEPGDYVIQACVESDEEKYSVSNAMTIRVRPAKTHDEEYIAQDFFSDEVGRVLQFDGSRVLQRGINTLMEVSTKLPHMKASAHANVALAMPYTKDYKSIQFKGDSKKAADNKSIKTESANPAEANKFFEKAFGKSFEMQIESLGHIDAKDYVQTFAASLKDEGKAKEALKVQEELVKVFTSRKVLPSVINDIKSTMK